MHTVHPAAQHLSLDDPLGGGPIDDASMLELVRHPQPPSAQLHVTSWGSKLLNAKKDCASRPSAVRAAAQVRPLTRPLAPSSRPKMALFFSPGIQVLCPAMAEARVLVARETSPFGVIVTLVFRAVARAHQVRASAATTTRSVSLTCGLDVVSAIFQTIRSPEGGDYFKCVCWTRCRTWTKTDSIRLYARQWCFHLPREVKVEPRIRIRLHPKS